MTITAERSTLTEKFGLSTGPLPLEPNFSRDYFEKERDSIFRHAWLCVGRVEELKTPGDFLVQEFPTVKSSVIVVRGRDGKIRGFHNMCKHRGNKVVRTGIHKGTAKGFSCGFHGWTYDLTGKLVIVPDEDQFFDVDKDCNSLAPFPVDVWEGFIFISAEPKESLREWMGELADAFDGFFTDYELISDASALQDANWKLCLAPFSEVYHLPFLHSQTAPESFNSVDNPLCHAQSIRIYDRHHSLSVLHNTGYTPTPAEMVVAKYSGMPAFPSMEADLAKLPDAVNPEKNPMWAADINIIFPCQIIMPWANGMILNYVWFPISETKTLWHGRLYWKKPKTWGQRINHELTRMVALNVGREDLAISEANQRPMESGAISEMYLSDQEVALRHTYQVVEKMIRS